MSKDFIGDLCAFIPKRPGQDKPSYPRVGSAFKDSGDGRISLKIDTMPITGGGWEGWLNIFPRDKGERTGTIPPTRPSKGLPFADMDDDIPF